MDKLTCSVPNADNLQGLQVLADYNGHGTTVADVLLVVGPIAAISLALVLCVYFNLRSA